MPPKNETTAPTDAEHARLYVTIEISRKRCMVPGTQLWALLLKSTATACWRPIESEGEYSPQSK